MREPAYDMIHPTAAEIFLKGVGTGFGLGIATVGLVALIGWWLA